MKMTVAEIGPRGGVRKRKVLKGHEDMCTYEAARMVSQYMPTTKKWKVSDASALIRKAITADHAHRLDGNYSQDGGRPRGFHDFKGPGNTILRVTVEQV